MTSLCFIPMILTYDAKEEMTVNLNDKNVMKPKFVDKSYCFWRAIKFSRKFFPIDAIQRDSLFSSKQTLEATRTKLLVQEDD